MHSVHMTAAKEAPAKISYEEDTLKAAKNAGVAGLGDIIYMVLGYASAIVITRNVGLEIFGIYSLAFTVASLVGIFARLGLENGVLRYVALYNGQGDALRIKGVITFATKMTSLLGLLLGFLLFILADFLSIVIFHNPDLAKALKTFAIAMPFLAVQPVWLSAIQGLQMIKDRVYVEKIIQPGLKLILLFVFLLLGWKLLGILSAMIIATLVATLMALYYLLKDAARFYGNEGGTKLEVREWFSFSTPLFLEAILVFVMMGMDTLMLGYFRSSFEVGVYNAALKVVPLIIMPLAAFNTIFVPMISEIYGKGELDKLEALFKIVTKWIFSLSFPIFLLIIIFSRPILSIFGVEFAVGSSALMILALGQLVDAAVGSVGYMLMMTGRPQMNLLNSALMSIMNIALNYTLIPHYGIVGAAIATGTSVAVINLLRLGEVYYFLKIHPYRLDLGKPIASSLAASAAIYLFVKVFDHRLTDSMRFPYLLLIPLFFVVYFALLYLFKLSDEDRVVISIIRRKLRTALAL